MCDGDGIGLLGKCRGRNMIWRTRDVGKACLASMLSRGSNLRKIRLGQMISVRSHTDRYVTRIPAVLDLQALRLADQNIPR